MGIAIALLAAIACGGNSGASGGDGRFDLACTPDDDACTEVCIFYGQAIDSFGKNPVNIDEIEVAEGGRERFDCPRDFCNWSSARLDTCDFDIPVDFQSHFDIDEGGEIVHE